MGSRSRFAKLSIHKKEIARSRSLHIPSEPGAEALAASITKKIAPTTFEPFKALSTQLQAKVAEHAPLSDQVSLRDADAEIRKNPDLHHRTDVAWRAALGTEGETGARLRNVVRRVRTTAPPAGALARSARDLNDPAVFTKAVAVASGDKSVLRHLVEVFPNLSAETRTAGEPHLTQALVNARGARERHTVLTEAHAPLRTVRTSAKLQQTAQGNFAEPNEAVRVARAAAIRERAAGDPAVLAPLTQLGLDYLPASARQEEFAALRASARDPDALYRLASKTALIADPAARASEHVQLREAADRLDPATGSFLKSSDVMRMLAYERDLIADPAIRHAQEQALRRFADADKAAGGNGSEICAALNRSDAELATDRNVRAVYPAVLFPDPT